MTRSELYSLVWSHPAVHVAKQLGISSARLRKVCIDYAVPLPPPGYWTQRAHGKQVASTPLPPEAPTIFGRLNAALRIFGEVPLQIADTQIAEFNLNMPPPPGAQSDVIRSFPERLSKQLAAAPADRCGFVSVRAPGLPVVSIGSQSAGRTVKMFSAFLTILDQRGFAWIDADDGQCIHANGELFSLKVYETRLRSPQQRHAYAPSGKLCVEIVDARPFRWSHRNLVGQWHDRKERPVEASLADALTAISAAAKVIKLCRARAENQASRLAIEAKDRRAEEARRSRERKFNEYLLAKAKAYAEYRQLVTFSDFLIANTVEPQSSKLGDVRAALRRLIAALRCQFTVQALLEDLERLDLLPADGANSPNGEKSGP
jgi:hypothetical protein